MKHTTHHTRLDHQPADDTHEPQATTQANTQANTQASSPATHANAAPAARQWARLYHGIVDQTRRVLREYREAAGLNQSQAADAFVARLEALGDEGYGWGMNNTGLSRLELSDERVSKSNLRSLFTLLSTYGVRLSDWAAQVEQRALLDELGDDPWAAQLRAQIEREHRMNRAFRRLPANAQQRIAVVLEALAANTQEQADAQPGVQPDTHADEAALHVAMAAAFITPLPSPTVSAHAPQVGAALQTALHEVDAWYAQTQAAQQNHTAQAGHTETPAAETPRRARRKVSNGDAC